MKKYYRIGRENTGFIAIDLIENNKVVGGYLIPDCGENEKNMADFMKKEGYAEYEKASHPS